MNGLRDAFARLGCVEEAHVADGAVLFRVDGAEASAVPEGGVLADHVRPAHVGNRTRRPTRRGWRACCAWGAPGCSTTRTTSRPVVTCYVHGEYVPAICETCGDFPEHLGIAYVTRGGRPECETYPDFGLDDVLDALERSR